MVASGALAIDGGLEQEMNEFEGILSWFGYWVDAGAADGRHARHKDAEAIYMRLLNKLFGWGLVDANEPGHNEPAVDLRDERHLYVVQVTSSCTRRKINDTLAKERIGHYRDLGYRLKFAFVGDQRDRSKVRGEGGWAIRNPHGIAFDRKEDSIFVDNLTNAFRALEPDRRAEVLELARGDIGRIGCGIPSQTVGIGVVRRINARLERQRREHPSFMLMEGGPDEVLLPKAKPIPNAERRASVGGGEPTYLSDVFRRSWESEGQCHLYITGPGGIGKTVSLLTFATEKDFLPWGVPAAYVPLYDLAQYHNEKRDCVDAYLRSTFPDDERAAIDRLSHEPWDGGPSLILLLDGHNEVPVDVRDDVDEGIRKWTERDGTQVVTTSRIPNLTGVASTWQVELRGLGRDEVKAHLTECGVVLPPEDSGLWQVLETPLILKLYADVEAFRDAMRVPYVRLEKSDSAGHLVWNYLQRELWSTLRWSRGDFSKAEYAAALLLTLPYVCWRMEAEHEFKVSGRGLLEYVREACRRWHGQRRPPGFGEVEDDLLSYYDDCDPERAPARQHAILSKERALLNWDGEEYALLHQSLRDGFAAIHLKNAMEAPHDGLPDEFGRPISEYVKDFLADVCDDGSLGALWEANRASSPTDAAATHNLLKVIHRKRDGNLTALDWSGMDLTGMCLFPYRKGLRMELSPSPSAFEGTMLATGCFTPQGHWGPVNCLCFLEDGRLVSGSDDGTVRFWDVSTGSEIGRPLRPGGMVKSVCAAAQGAVIASSSSNARVCLWDVSKGVAVDAPLQTHRYGVQSICLGPSGLLAIGSNSGTVRLIDTELGNQTVELDEGHEGAVRSVCFSPDERLLVSASSDGTVRLWDVTSRSQKRDPLGGGWGKALTVRLSPDGKSLACGFVDGSVRVWDLDSGDPWPVSLEPRGGAVRSVCFSPDGRLLAGASADGGVRIWSVSTWKQVCAPLEGAGKKSLSLCFSPDGAAIVSGFADGAIRVWDVSTGGLLVPPIKGYRGWVNTVCFSPDGSLLAFGSGDGAVRLWDTSTGAMAAPPMAHGGHVESVCFDPDGRTLASSSSDHTVRLWGVSTGVMLAGPLAHPNRVNSVCFSPDGATLACGCSDGRVYLRDATTGEATSSPLEHGGLVESVCFRREDGMLASGSSDHTVCLWNLATGKEVRLYHEGAIRSVCFSPNGTWLACGASDRAVRLWDVSTRDDMRLSSLWRISTGSRSLSFSPDGTVIAAGLSDGSVRLWGLSAGGPLCKPLAHGGRVRSVWFSPDGSVLASGSSDGIVMLWDVCELTDAEARRKYFTGAIEPLHGIDLTGLDFSMAIIDDPHDREVLRQNGAAV